MGVRQRNVADQTGPTPPFTRDTPDGSNHKLTYGQWQATGFASFDNNPNAGFIKLTWNDTIGFSSDLARGQGRPISANEWALAGYPNPLTSRRFPGDQFTQRCGSDTITYQGPTLYKDLTFAEWQAAGAPGPSKVGGC